MSILDAIQGAAYGALIPDQPNPIVEKRKRADQFSDDFRESEIGRLNQAISAIQADPNLSPAEKSGKINAARGQIAGLYTPVLGKKRIAKLREQMGLGPEPTAQTGIVPAETPITLQPIPFPSKQGAPEPIPVATGEGPSPQPIPLAPLPVTLPGKGETKVSLTPPTISDTLAAATPPPKKGLAPSPLGDPYEYNGRYYQPMLSAEGKISAEPMPEGFKPTLKAQHLTDYGRFLEAFAKDRGKSSDELGPEELAEARKQWAQSSQHGTVKETIIPDPTSPTKFSKIAYNPIDGKIYSKQVGAIPPRGFIPTHRVTKDPFGNETVSDLTPIIGGMGAAPSPVQQPKPKAAKTPQASSAPATAPTTTQLDAQGHIPASAGGNPQVREAANRLFDGAAVKDLPTRVQIPASVLARKYGWQGQGMFAPKDKLLIRESTAILQQFAKDPSLAVLDDPVSRQKIMQVLQNPAKRGAIGQMIQTTVAAGLNPQEQQFVTLYNQSVGRIAGLSQLVRSGRATEATIERLMTELPNPASTSSSTHAKEKFKQLQNEIDIALTKGSFGEIGSEGGDLTYNPATGKVE